MSEKNRYPQTECTYVPVIATIERISDLTALEKLFTIKMPEGKSLGHKPGQFVQVSILGMEEAPISICNSPTKTPGTFELAIRRAGILTSALHAMKPGDTVGIRGPFGSCFPVDEIRGKDLIFIAGGCGLAPLRSVIQYCEDNASDYGRMTILYGAKSPADVMFKDEVDMWKNSPVFDCRQTVDNAPREACYSGNVGLITKLIPELDVDPSKTVAIIVGPPVMYKNVIAELGRKKINSNQIIVSLERYMRCGVGKCGHCVIEHIYCCLDGPVFWLAQIEKIAGAI